MMRILLDLATVPARLRFAGSLTIAAAASGRADLLALLDDLPAGPVRLDFADVAEADGAGVQLLVAAARGLQAAGHPLQVAACSGELLRAARALGAAEGDRVLGLARAAAPAEEAC